MINIIIYDNKDKWVLLGHPSLRRLCAGGLDFPGETILQALKKIIVSIGLVVVLIALMISGIFFFIRAGENHNHLTLYGNVDVRQVDISFRVSGKVETHYFEEGDFVQNGIHFRFRRTLTCAGYLRN